MAPVIETTHLHKSYGPHVALRGIDIAVQPGEVYGFIGPNGAGKTTTMRLLLDILRPTSGAVRVLGQDPRAGGASLRSRIGYLPGELRLDGRYDVATLLDFYLRLSEGTRGRHGTAKRDWRPWAERVDLDVSRQVRGLSKGNKQKVGLVQAFAHHPELLILDEPTSGLDPLIQQEFLTMCREARAAGQTVFLSSHVLSEIEHVADRVAVLREGRVELVSTVADLRHRLGTRMRVTFAGPVPVGEFAALPGVRRAQSVGDYLHLDLDGGPDAVVKALARHEVRSLEAVQPDLEEAVMSLYQRDDPPSPGGTAPGVPVGGGTAPAPPAAGGTGPDVPAGGGTAPGVPLADNERKGEAK